MQRVLFIILFIISASVSAQVRTVVYQSIGDVYKSRPDFKSEYRSMPSKKMQPFDMQKLLVDDKDEKGINAKPFRFGYGFDVSYTLDDGTWEETDTLRVWTMKISSSGAYSLNFIFDRLRLTQGAELYIFNTDATMMYGPVTALQNITEGTCSMQCLVVAIRRHPCSVHCPGVAIRKGTCSVQYLVEALRKGTCVAQRLVEDIRKGTCSVRCLVEAIRKGTYSVRRQGELLRRNNLRQIVTEYGETFLHSLIFIRTKYNRICLVQNNVYLATGFQFFFMEQNLHAPKDRPELGLPKEKRERSSSI